MMPFNAQPTPRSFESRGGGHPFPPPTSQWGYLAMLNQWAQQKKVTINWRWQQDLGQSRLFSAIPVLDDEVLWGYRGEGPTKRKAKEVSAGRIVSSGHC
ncbi:hypothetical protein BOTBODRAFT_66066 [Botryobasidium botryosum FD-172 SS1]|uniref:Uncharacterized protein n=1 Tax=Botryobasidium botryosum (strain FD-172 SS1) TaxID=930990 RepID=A0A067MSC3_BOTB1|nr:hypothetical protein BOTBODRAFT_66066 [Botryobasidium botryosum FD-172 SS1]